MKAKYFVLNPEKKGPDDEYATAARIAMLTFAEKILKIDQDLAQEVIEWVSELVEGDKIRWKGKQP